jgi:integrase
LFPGHPSDLALELLYGLRLAAVRAGVRKVVHPRVFRRMKLRAFREAGVREDAVANAMGHERPWPRRRVDETVEEAEAVLGGEGGIFKKLVKRIERWLG